MTEDERKTIEYWKEQLKSYKKEIEQRQNDEFKGYGTLEDMAKLKYCNLHTMLNLIEKQQTEINALQMEHNHDVKMIDEVKGEAVRLYKEIDRYKKMLAEYTAHTVCSDWKQMHKQNEDLEMLYKGCQIELEEKDKIIDEMAKHIKTTAIYECPSKDCEDDGSITCEDCIKEHFKNKVETEEK